MDVGEKSLLMVARYKPILALGGATGGCGKTLLTAALASMIGEKGKKVVVADFSWGTPVLHHVLGDQAPEYSMRQYISDKFCNLHSILNPTHLPGVRLLSHQGDEYGWQALTYAQKQRLFRSLNALNCDGLIMDVLTGCSPEAVDYMVFAPQIIWVAHNSNPSRENTLQLARSLAFRRLHQLCKGNSHVQSFVEDAFSPRSQLMMPGIPELLEQMRALNSEAVEEFSSWQKEIEIGLVINHSETADEAWTDWLLLTEALTGFKCRILGTLPSLAQLDTRRAASASHSWTDQRPKILGDLLRKIEGVMYG